MDKNFTAADARLLSESSKLSVYINEIIEDIEHNATLGRGFKAAVKSKTNQFVDLWLEVSW